MENEKSKTPVHLWFKLMSFLYRNRSQENYGSRIGKELKVTYSSICKLLDGMQSMGFIETTYVGRRRLIKLTEKGEIVGKNLSDVELLIK